MAKLPDGLELHGEIAPKKFGKLDVKQIQAWILGKMNLKNDKAYLTSVSQVTNDFMSAKAKETKLKFEKKEVWHTSAGKEGKPGSCTLFFTNPEKSVGKIVGIGEHATSTTYSITWSADDKILPTGKTINPF